MEVDGNIVFFNEAEAVASLNEIFLDDGEVPMDNNVAEQSIRPFCVGKKNWVMIDTVAGAEASAMIYSIAETVKANNLKTYNYFKYLWKKSLDTWMVMVWISVKICFLGQTSCQRNAENNFNDMPLFGAVAYVTVLTMERLRI